MSEVARVQSRRHSGSFYKYVARFGYGDTNRVFMKTDIPTNEVQLGAQGRLVIPAAMRKALHLKPGDRLVVRQVGESLVLERRETVVKRLQGLFAHIPDDVSLVDELIESRREEAAREMQEN